MIPTLGGRGEARSRNGRSMRRRPKKGDPGSRTAPRPSRPRNLGSSSKCRGGLGTAVRPKSLKGPGGFSGSSRWASLMKMSGFASGIGGAFGQRDLTRA
jgi:hypothetical protein